MASPSTTNATITFILGLAAAAPPALAGHAYDGAYIGPWTNTLSNNSGECRAGNPAVHLTVKHNRFNIRWVGQQVPVTIGDDGTIKGGAYLQQGRNGALFHVSISGKASPTGFEADAAAAACAYHMVMKKN